MTGVRGSLPFGEQSTNNGGEQLVSEADAVQRPLSLVEEEPGTDVGAVDDVEGVDDIVEAV